MYSKALQPSPYRPIVQASPLNAYCFVAMQAHLEGNQV